jgi:aminoglycoside phosphotransferase (APT) family kinase protein
MALALLGSTGALESSRPAEGTDVDLEPIRRRLEAFLAGQGVGDDLVVESLEPIVGGFSKVTTRFRVRTFAGTSTYVLRADPLPNEALMRTDLGREWQLLKALNDLGTIPMPTARWTDPDGSELGVPAIILDYVDGPQLLARLVLAGDLERRRLALELADVLGRLHRFAGSAVPDSFERPVSWDAYIGDVIGEWRDLERRHVESNPFIRWVAGWLDRFRPPEAPLTLVHGDFQTSNVIIEPAGGLKVIDWEFAHIGDPRIDLGWMQNVAAFSPPDPIGCDPAAFCDRYCAVSGLSADVVNPVTIGYFSILAGVKALGALMQGMAEMSGGRNHLVTSAYLVSALPHTHRLWRNAASVVESAVDALTAQMDSAT